MIPYIKGRVSTQAHVGIPEGTYEEEYARGGFSGRYAHLYRSHPPVGWTKIEGPLKPRAFDLNEIPSTPSGENPTLAAGDFWGLRQPLLRNKDVEIAWLTLENDMTYYFRDADAEEVFFVHAGEGVLETDFGPLYAEVGDYLVVPRGTVFRWRVSEPLSLLNIRSGSEIQFPEKGLLGQHALFDPAVIKTPTPVPDYPVESKSEYELRILRCDEITRVTYPYCPLDVVGWKGTLTVWQLNIRDIRPVLSDRYHLPPSAHATFVAQGFVICTFLPRPLENGDPAAMKVPFYHSNIDYDEVLFYHQGTFFSRAGVGPGMMTFHPQGIQHGPQAAAVKRSHDLQRTNEVAVMIDTQRPLQACEAIHGCENPDYWKSWQTGA